MKKGFLKAVLFIFLFFSLTGQAWADLTLGTAADYAMLALYNSGNSVGLATVNSATAVTGDFGYANGVTSTTNQKIGEDFLGQWTGTAYVHSGATFSYDDKNYIPSGGVVIGGSADSKLNQASIDAYAAASSISGMAATQTFTGDINDTNASFTSTQSVNVVDITGYVNMNSDTFTLTGRAGFTDWFIVRVGGSFDFSASTVALVNTDASHVLWFFDDDQHILINKAETVFKGTLLAPYLSAGNGMTYHNPASFEGAIISNNLDIHSDFNLTHVPFAPVPIPGAVWLLGSGLIGLVAMGRRRIKK